MPMRNLKNSILRAAVLAAIAAQPCISEAVHVSPGGEGQVLLFPYYTVRNSFSTLISVANTQANTKIVKVRFLEGKNSREVMDFNLFLLPNDTWTAAIVATPVGARVITNDNSCVTPSDFFLESRTDGLTGLNDFKNYLFSGANADSTTPSFTTFDRTREGFFEVIEMGVLDSSTAAGTTAIGFARQNCNKLDSYDGFVGNPSTTRFPNVGAQLMLPPAGGLAGRATLIRADNGSNFTYSATALDNWSTVIKYTPAGDPAPTVADTSQTSSINLTADGAITSTWVTGRDAVSAALMRYTLQNEFVLDAGTTSQTDWIVTFPTKRFYVTVGAGNATAPFTSNFSNQSAGACEAYSALAFNREAPVSSAPLPAGEVCWASTVVPMGSANSMTGSLNTSALSAAATQFVNGATTTPSTTTTPSLRGPQGPNGQFIMRFDAGAASIVPFAAFLNPAIGQPKAIFEKTFGLPVIGFMMHNYQNAGVQSRYGGLIDHKYFTRIE